MSGARAFQWNNNTFRNATIISKPVKNTTLPISSARLDADVVSANGSSINWFMSNNNGGTWETTQLGQLHQFTSSGRNLTWRADIIINGTIMENITGRYPAQSPIIRSVTFSGSSGFPSNIRFDVGNDGTTEYQFVQNLSTNNLTSFNATPSVMNYVTTNCKFPRVSCAIPIKVSVGTSGILNISNYSFPTTVNWWEYNKTTVGVFLNKTGTQPIITGYGGNGSYNIGGLNWTLKNDYNLP